MATSIKGTEFRSEVTDRALDRSLPQRIGTVLWLPALAMGLMAFPVGIVLAVVRAARLADDASASATASLGHFVPAFNFLGFAAVFAAISFAIARILGEFRAGGGLVQEAAGRRVETLKMPGTAKAFILTMAVGAMVLLAAVVLHLVAGATIAGGSATALANAEQWAIWLEAVRRFGVAIYLLSFALGLGTIITVLRFQAVRMRELPEEAAIRG